MAWRHNAEGNRLDRADPNAQWTIWLRAGPIIQIDDAESHALDTHSTRRDL